MKKFTAMFLLLVLIVSMFAGCQSAHRYDETETFEVSDLAGATAHESETTLGTEESPPTDTGGDTETETPETEPATDHSTEATDPETAATDTIESSEDPTHSEPSESGNEVTATEPATEPATEHVTEAPTAPHETECSHNWSEWKVSKAATCTKKGTKTRTCTKCDASESKDIPATGHNWRETSRTNATCTKNGVINYKCANSGCTETKQETGAKATGHSWVKGTVVAPTCTSKGYTNYTCSTCHESKQGDWKDALGHNYKVTTTAPTCTQCGHNSYVCSRCGNHYEADGDPALGHAWVHHDAVCHEVDLLTCDCGAQFHTYEDWYAHAHASYDLDYLNQHAGFEYHSETIVDEPAYDECSRCHTRK